MDGDGGVSGSVVSVADGVVEGVCAGVRVCGRVVDDGGGVGDGAVVWCGGVGDDEGVVVGVVIVAQYVEGVIDGILVDGVRVVVSDWWA